MSDKPEEKAEVVEEKKTAKPAEPATAAAPVVKPAVVEEKKRQKISRMNLSEVESQLKTTKEKMGAFQSDFARHLLARKSELSGLASKKK